MRCPIIFSLAIILSLPIPQKLLAEDFLCAHLSAPAHNPLSKNVAAKSAQPNANSTRAALVLFAKFRDELPGQIQAPAWVKDLFDRGKPGSFSHFYETMSFQRHRIAGQAYPQRYVSSEPAASYLATDTDKFGRFGQFSREILQQADRDINFARFDNDGPDGAPNSGDDDGIVDVVFIVTASAPTNFLFQGATGIADLGLGEDFISADIGVSGAAIRIATDQGVIQQGRTYTETVGVMCHEYGHILGLPDLFNTDFLQQENAGPTDDSAGIGNWGLMGWGATGWNDDDDPNSLSAWSRMQLGWTTTREVSHVHEAAYTRARSAANRNA